MLQALRKRVLRPVVLVPLLVAVGAGTYWGVSAAGGSSSSSTQTTQREVAASQGDMDLATSASGTIEPTNVENLNFTSPGTVTAVNVSAGQEVAAGQVLASINSASLQSQLAQAQAALSSAQAQLSSDESSNASSTQIGADQAGVSSAQAQVDAANAALAGAQLTSPIAGKVATVNLTVGQQLGSNGQSGTSLGGTGTGTGSGNTGVGGSSGAGSSGNSNGSGAGGAGSSGGGGGAAGGGGSNGQSSSSGSSSSGSGSSGSSTAQIEVISDNSYVVNLSVDDTQIGLLSVNDTATVTPSTSASGAGTGGGASSRFGGLGGRVFFGGGGGGGGGGGAGANGNTANGNSTNSSAGALATASGHVTSVGQVASASSGVATFPVTVQVNGAPSGFHGGAAATVSIVYKHLTNVTEVPLAAVSRTGGQPSVVLEENGKRVTRTVTTGAASGGMVQITSGLQPGDVVVETITTSTGASNRGGNGTQFGRGGGGFGGGGGLGRGGPQIFEGNGG